MSDELMVRDPSLPMTAKDVGLQVLAIQEVMKVAMHDGVHYGVIPGCGDKPSLLKAGAEKLALMFRLAPKYTITMRDLGGGHREYEVVTDMYHAPTGIHLGSGVGSASTTETKWRYRWENTGKDVPKEYWENRNPETLGGTDYVARKIRDKTGQKWVIMHKVEHDNPSDYYNTVLKMSKKRSQIDATLTVTAASDIFTQGIEELKENGIIDVEPVEPKDPKHAPMKQPEAVKETPPGTEPGPGSNATPEESAPWNKEQESGAASEEKPEQLEPNTFMTAIIMDKVDSKTGSGAKGKWERTYSKASDGEWYQTFDKKIGDAMRNLQGVECSVIYKLEKNAKGELRSVISIGPIKQ